MLNSTVNTESPKLRLLQKGHIVHVEGVYVLAM